MSWMQRRRRLSCFRAPVTARKPNRKPIIGVEKLDDRINPAPIPSILGLSSSNILLGEQANFGFRFANTSPTDAGFAPFIEVAMDTSGRDGAATNPRDGYSTPTVTGAGLTLTPATTITLIAGQTTYINPLTGESRAVPAGFGKNDTIFIYSLPFGSFSPTQSTAVTITAPTSKLADVGTILPIAVTGGFRDNEAALNGPGIYFGPATAGVTPELYRFKKIYLGPESETATGPNFVRRYRLEVDIADGQTLTNTKLNDDLAASMQIVAKTATNMAAFTSAAPASNVFAVGNLTGSAVNTAPDGTLSYNFGTVVGTPLAVDAAYEFDFYIPRDLAGGGAVVPQGTDSVTHQNTASTQANWTPLDGRDAANQNVAKATPDNGPHTLEEQSIAIQKSVEAIDPATGLAIPAGQSIRPGITLLRYTLNYQVSDYYAFDNLFVNDTLSDGQRLFLGTRGVVTSFPTMTVNNAFLTGSPNGSRQNTSGNFQGNTVIDYQRRYNPVAAADPTSFPVDGPATGTISPTVFANLAASVQADGLTSDTGTTGLRFDISKELKARLGANAGRLVGGEVGNDGTGPTNNSIAGKQFGGTTGTIVFYTEVSQEFSDSYRTANGGSNDASVDQGDILSNAVNDPRTAGRDGIIGDQLLTSTINAAVPTIVGTGSDDSGSSVVIPYGVQEKQIYAINGQTVPPTGPTDPPLSIQPGDRVTYRLTYTLPISSFEQLQFIDFPPLPVMDVDDSGPFTFVRDPAAYGFLPGQVGVVDAAGANPADDTYFNTFAPGNGAGRNPSLAVDSVSNSITLNFGTQEDTQRRSTQISVLVTFVVGNQPFSSDLFLTNQLRISEGSTNAGTTTVEDLRRFELVRPFVTVQKGTAAGNTTGFTVGTGTDQIIFGGTNVALPAVGSNVASTVINRAGTVLSGTNAIFNATQSNSIGAQNITPSNLPVDAGDTVRYAVVVQNSGKGDAFDVNLTDTIQPQYNRTAFDPTTDLRVIRGDGTVLTPATDYTITYNGLTGAIAIQLVDNYSAGNVGGATEDSHIGALSRGNRTAGAIDNGSNTIVVLYDVTLLNTVTPNQLITNTAIVPVYSNSEGGVDLTDPAVVPGATEPTDQATVTTRLPLVAKTLVSTEFTAPGNNLANQATIGEYVTYTLTLTVPEGFTPAGAIIDTLNNGLAFVDVLSVATSSGVSVATPPDAGNNPANTTITNSARTITFGLGDITNSNTDNATTETITITYRAIVLNTNGVSGTANNQAGSTRNNSARFEWTSNTSTLTSVSAGQTNTLSGGVSGTLTPVTIVEPTVTPVKDVANVTAGGAFGQRTRGDAGDEIDYRIVLTGSGTTAYEVSLNDPIPISFFSGGVAIQSATSTGTIRFNGIARTATTADFSIDGSGVLTFTAGLDVDIETGATLTVVVRGTDFTGSTGQLVTNTAEVRWTSLDGTPGTRSTHNTNSTERTGADGLLGTALNDYRLRDDAVIESPPVVRKSIVATSEAHTPGSNVAIGEIVRYRVYVSLGETPTGVPTSNVQIRDFLPTGLSFLNDGTARYGFISSNGANLTSSTLGGAGIIGNETTLASLLSSSLTGIFGDADLSLLNTGSATGDPIIYVSGQDIFFRLGDISNADRDNNVEYVVIEYNVLVTNQTSNQAATNLDNYVTALANDVYIDIVNDANGDGLGNGEATIVVNPANPTNLPTARVTVVEPNIQIVKNVIATDGFVVTYQLTITNTNTGNTTTAFNTRILDILNATNFGLNTGSVSIAPGTATGITNGTAGNTVDLTIDTFPVGNTVTITYTVNVLVTPTGVNTLVNVGTTTTTGLPGAQGTLPFFGTTATTIGASGTATGERNGTDGVGGLLNDYASNDLELLGSLGDRVYYDANGDGVQDAGEPGLVGVPVTVTWAGLDGNFATVGDNSVITVLTGTDGKWIVNALPLNGKYQVTVPTVFAGMGVTDATDDGVLTASNKSSITLTGVDAGTTNNRTQDFGYRGTASLGNRVFIDANGDGIQSTNGLEPSLPGVTVNMTWAGADNIFGNADDLTFSTVTTNAAGTGPNYAFNFLPAGDFKIAVSTTGGTGGVPNNATLTDSLDNAVLNAVGTVTTNLTLGENETTIDFGYKGTASIGDTVWYDADGNGVQGAGEPGIAGQTVTLLWSGPDGAFGGGDDVTFTTTTDANGNYLFPSLPVSGEFAPYRVTVANPTGYPTQTFDSDGLGTANRSELNLNQNENNVAQDFGFRGTASLGDFVWLDENGNGKQDAGDAGIDGVAVQLFFDRNNDGDFADAGENLPLLTTTTAGGGKYSFPNLAAGNYQVGFGNSDGTTTYTRTVQDVVAATDALDSDANVATGRTGTYTLANGQTIPTVDAGLYVPVSIGDTVWFDANNNGAYDSATEPGIPNASVTVVWFGPDGVFGGGDDQTFSATTDSAGMYLVTSLPPGEYQVSIDPASLPEGLVQTFDLDGTGTANTTSLTAISGVDRLDADFGYRGTGSVGDTVFLDINNNGKFDTGEGIAGVQVQISGDLDGDGSPESLFAITDTDGQYTFPNLRVTATGVPYTVTIDKATLPAASVASVDPDGVHDSQSVVTITSRIPNNVLQDFGYRSTGSVGDTIFLDANKNGKYDVGEGITGVTVTLTSDFDGDGLLETQSTVTDADGQYLFTGLITNDGKGAGVEYTVTVDSATLPTDVSQTVDPDGVLSNTSIITLTDATPNNLLQDFGYRGTANVGDTVWFDANNDGIKGANEPGIAGAKVTVVWFGQDGIEGNADDVTTTTVTAGNGFWQVTGLPVGNYRATVDTATLPNGLNVQTYDLDGTSTPSTTPFTLELSQNRVDVDFGYRGTAKLGDTVWVDLNGDGIQTPNEPGIPHATVTLVWYGQDGVFGGGDDATLTTITDSKGNYQFIDLPSGNFQVNVNPATIPANLLPTYDLDGKATANVTLVSLAVGESNPAVDFGYKGTASVGDFVWYDANNDGTPTFAEPGIAGVTITLTFGGADGDLTTTNDNITFVTTTGADGKYLISGLPVSINGALPNYIATVSNVPAIFTVQTFDLDGKATPNAATFVLGASQNRRDVDFGFQGTASLGDYVFQDFNGNGVQDAGDTGVSGVTVNLLDAAGNKLATTTSSVDGKYSFPGLAAGNYKVAFVAPGAFAFTAKDQQGNNAADSDADRTTGITATIVLGTGEINPTIDAGLYVPVSIGDTVYFDANGDGKQASTGEPGIPGATVTLKYAGPDGVFGTPDDATFSTTTDASGKYLFTSLPPGNFQVDISKLPNGLTVATADLDGIATLNTTKLTAISGTNRLDADFGYRGPGSIGDTVYFDFNGDGLQTVGEPGIAGAKVTVTWLGFDGVAGGTDDVTYTTTTDATGKYSVANLPLGNYTVGIDPTSLPTGFVPVSDLDGVRTPNSTKLTLGTSNPNRVDADFGYVGTGSLGDRVWVDFNADGKQDANEPGVPGATVVVNYAGVDNVFGTADDGTFTSTTGANGIYGFPNLPLGTYKVSVTGGLPTGTVPTYDLDGTPNNTTTTSLSQGQNRTDVDFGVRGTSSIAGSVFRDDSNDGRRDPGEPGFQGVTITLSGTDILGNPITVVTTTNGNGDYNFPGLLPGTYTVTESTQPPDTADGLDSEGNVNGNPMGTAGNDIVQTIVLGAGQSSVANVFGELAGLVSGTVYVDRNRDGVRDPNEPRLPGVTIQLIDSTGRVIRTTTTDTDGNYLIRGFAPGTYTVRELQPDGYGNGTPNDRVVDVPPLGITGIDFGEITGTVAGFVYRDYSIDGMRTLATGETGIGGTTIAITGTDVRGNVVNRTTTTDSLGRYEFADLLQGSYTLTETQPSGFFYDGLDTVGNFGGTASNDKLVVGLPPGSDGVDYNFGEFPPADPFGYVYQDLNLNGIRDVGEPGIAGVPITISGTAFGGTIFARPLVPSDFPNGSLTIFTDANGLWQFPILPPGTYTIVESVQPNGFLDGTEQDGDPNGPPATVGNDRFDNIVLAPNPIRGPFNFGEYVPQLSKLGFLGSTLMPTTATTVVPNLPRSPAFTVNTGTPNTPALIATSTGPGTASLIRVFDYASGGEKFRIQPYESTFVGGVRVAIGDVSGDGTDDIVTGIGPGGGPRIRVFSGKDGAVVKDFFAYEESFRGGLFVAVGDINGDGVGDIITGTEVGGGPRVSAFDGKTGAVLANFFAFDVNQRGGVRVAAGDFNGDGKAEIVATTGEGVATMVRVMNADGSVVREFAPYTASFTGGVSLAVADVNGDGVPDIATGAEVGGGPHVQLFDGKTGSTLSSFYAYDSGFTGGVRVGLQDVDGDGKADIVTGMGVGGSSEVRVLRGTDLQPLDRFFAFDDMFTGGVYVG